MFGALGLWQRVTALPALAQDHTMPVARTTAGCALQTEQEIRQTSGNGRDGEAHVGERWRPFWTHSYPVCGPVTPLSKETYLSEMSAPVYGRPAVEGVLHRQVSRV